MYAKLVRFTQIANTQGLSTALRLAASALARRARGPATAALAAPPTPAESPALVDPLAPAEAPAPPEPPSLAEPPAPVEAPAPTAPAVPAALNPWAEPGPPPSAPAPVPSLAHLIEPPGTRPPPDTHMLVGVIMPVRNRPVMVAAAIRSVQAQSYPDWRLYVVDDASTDDTARVLAGFAADPRVRVITNAISGGPSAARNLALAACEADGAQVAAYLDSDNTYYPHYLAEVARAYSGAAGSAPQCAYCAMIWATPNASWLCFDQFDTAALLAMRMSLDMNAFSHRLALLREAGAHDAQMVRHHDWDFVLRCVRLAAPLPLPVLGVHYRAGAWPRITNTLPGAPDAYRVREKFAVAIGAGRRVLLLTYDYPQQSESYIDCEVRWLSSRGFEVRVHRQEPGASPGQALVPVYTGTLEEALDEFRPQAAHAHWFNIAAQYAPALAARGIALTARGHSIQLDVVEVEGLLENPLVARLFLFPQYAGHWPGNPKIGAMSCCFDGTRFIPQLTKPAGPRVVLRVAACLPTKDLEMFFRVAARCPEYRFRAALARIGAYPDLPRHFTDLNASLGNPVELLFDVSHPDIARMVGEASVYLYTADLSRPIGMPVSIPEAMACAAVPLVRDHPALRALAGPPGLVYADEDHAVSLLREMAGWDEAQWCARATECVEHAYLKYADSVVLAPLGELLAAPPETRRHSSLPL